MLCVANTCPHEVDAVGIHWPLMLAGHIAVQRCPPGMTGWRVGCVVVAVIAMANTLLVKVISVVGVVQFQLHLIQVGKAPKTRNLNARSAPKVARIR